MRVFLVGVFLGLAQGKFCNLYQISDDAATCGQSDLDCKFTGPAKLFKNTLKDGTCAAKGYTKMTGTKTMRVPVIGDIVLTFYEKPELSVGGNCSMYLISMSAATCHEANFDCKYVHEAKEFKTGLKDGTCTAQGYTKKTGSKPEYIPPLHSDVVFNAYAKPDPSVSGNCSVYLISDDAATCDDASFDCKYVDEAKRFRKGLKDGTCGTQGYTNKTGSKTEHIPLHGDVVINIYAKPGFSGTRTCSFYEISKDAAYTFLSMSGERFSGKCKQSDIECKFAYSLKRKGYKEGTCSSRGYAHKIVHPAVRGAILAAASPGVYLEGANNFYHKLCDNNPLCVSQSLVTLYDKAGFEGPNNPVGHTDLSSPSVFV